MKIKCKKCDSDKVTCAETVLTGGVISNQYNCLACGAGWCDRVAPAAGQSAAPTAKRDSEADK